MYSKINDTKTLLNKQNTGWKINTKETLYICTGRKDGSKKNDKIIALLTWLGSFAKQVFFVREGNMCHEDGH
jgi:hypothetical protein